MLKNLSILFIIISAIFANEIPIATYDEVKALPNHPEILLVDVREPSELKETGIIPTSINIPLSEVEVAFSANTTDEDFKNKYGKEKPKPESSIIVSCKAGGRAQKGAEAIKKLGFENVRNYKGSWLDWAEHEGLKKE